MGIKFFVAGLYVDYRREKITLQALVITENVLAVHLYRTWEDLDFASMIRDVNRCCVLKNLKRIYYDKYALSNKVYKKLDDRFRPIAMNHHKRCDMVETVKLWVPVISCVPGSPFSKQHFFLAQCKNSQGEVVCYPISNIFTGNAEAFCLAVYGARKTIAKYVKNRHKLAFHR